MLMPSIFGENLFDDFFNDFPFYDYDKEMKNTEKKLYGRKASHVMKTDIRELDDGYEVVVDLPGFTKDEVQATLENGYLTISAEKGLDKDEKEKESGRYIRKERYAGACSRSFYVGEDITEEDIKAEFKHGLLKTLRTEEGKQNRLWSRKRQSPLKDKSKKSKSVCRPGMLKFPGGKIFIFFRRKETEPGRAGKKRCEDKTAGMDARDFRIRKINCIQ